jgi:hypothetical protein
VHSHPLLLRWRGTQQPAVEHELEFAILS